MELYDAVSVVLVGHTQYQLTLLSLSHEMILFREDHYIQNGTKRNVEDRKAILLGPPAAGAVTRQHYQCKHTHYHFIRKSFITVDWLCKFGTHLTLSIS